MNSIIYYVPGRPTRADLDRMFVNHPKFQTMENTVGVEGLGPGMMYGDERGANPALDRDNQEWFMDPGEEFWFGWAKGKQPGPSDLQKTSTIEGEDYNGWMVPKVRTWSMNGENASVHVPLPKSPVWDGEKFGPGPIMPAYRHIANLGEKVWAVLMDLEKQTGTGTLRLPEDAMRLVYEIMAINYYFGPAEFAQLAVVPYDFWEMVKVYRLFTGYYDITRLLEEQQKKTAQALP